MHKNKKKIKVEKENDTLFKQSSIESEKYEETFKEKMHTFKFKKCTQLIKHINLHNFFLKNLVIY
ncbi:hypothetical protein BpHYR1_011608 [Brachionus plicatilis]|uniref:Uncharacterized protein n=1 Tax=Brachionus plicatilis TaxID=10195 RepID=A0A3M7QBA7_BRAPC|nr:hypothetical protein BpHYR1_011608 [Brachionus plicatilis]